MRNFSGGRGVKPGKLRLTWVGVGRQVFGASFKAKVALAAVRGDKTTTQSASQYAGHANQVSAWKRQLRDDASELVTVGRSRQTDASAREEELFDQIGRLKMELEWLKDTLASQWRVLRCTAATHRHHPAVGPEDMSSQLRSAVTR